MFSLPGQPGDADDGMGVYVIRDGRTRLTPVRIGARNTVDAWIQQGLSDGASVVVDPSNAVRDGVRVAVRDVGRRL